MTRPPVAAIVVTYQSRRVVGAAMDALRIAHDAGLLDCIVVDNASTDGTAEFLRQEHSWARIIESRKNLGYGRGLNCGFELVDAEYVLFMNPDAVIASEGVSTLIGFLEKHPGAGIVGPAIEEADGTFQAAGGLPTPFSIVAEAAGLPAYARRRRAVLPAAPAFRTDWLCGAVLLARSSLIRRLGGFDPRFFLYFEETDLCRRAQLAGAELWAVGGALVRHLAGASAHATDLRLSGGCIAEHYYRSRFYYLAKHHGWLQALSAEIAELLVLAVHDLGSRLRRRTGGALTARLKAPLLAFPRKEV